MIQDLENIVISYLDPDSYKILQTYNHHKYNKLSQIQAQYEKIIPDIIRNNIVETGVILKTSIVILINELDYTLSHDDTYQRIREIQDKVQLLIQDWFTFRLNELLTEYRKLDQIIINEFSVPNIHDELTLFFNQDREYVRQFKATYGADIIDLKTLEDGKRFISFMNLTIKTKYLIDHNQRFNYKEYIYSVAQYFDEIKNIEIELTELDDLDKVREFINKLYEEVFGNDVELRHYQIFQEISISEEYHKKRLFLFSDFDSRLMKLSDNIWVDKPKLPEIFQQSLYDIMETVDQFFRIYHQYMDSGGFS